MNLYLLIEIRHNILIYNVMGIVLRLKMLVLEIDIL